MAMCAMSDSQMSYALEAMSESISSLLESWELLREKAKTKITEYRQQTFDDKFSCVLECFIDQLPEHGSKVVCEYIIENEDQIQRLGDHLLNALLIRRASGKTPSVTPSPFETPDEVAQNMEASVPRQQSIIKKRCLKRDWYRCMISGQLDSTSRAKFPDMSDDDWYDLAGPTNATHIIPYRLGKYDDSDDEKEIAYIWTSLYALFPSLKQVIGQDSINEERNVMTTAEDFNRQIGTFRLALEATDEINVYKLVEYGLFKKVRNQLPEPNEQGERVVRFTKPSDVKWELPSPEILAVHAALAQVLHASGMAEIVEKVFRDFEEIRNMHVMSDKVSSLLGEHLLLLVHG
ncbi:hypothetical protein ZTR_10714 [Talaromyces verruculosus]|nr:hypothetical protein ZTR_10714 [Talaromyces verruculosus]